MQNVFLQLLIFAAEVESAMASSLGGMARVCAFCGKAEPEGVWFPKCARCVEFKLPSTLYCSPVCQANHWPQHKVFHQKQKAMAKGVVESGLLVEHARRCNGGERRRLTWPRRAATPSTV